MLCFHGLIGSKEKVRDGQKYRYGWELVLLHKVRDWKDGISFFEFVMNLDRFVADHNPRFEVRLSLFNWTVFEFSVYNIHHMEDGLEGGACGDEE